MPLAGDLEVMVSRISGIVCGSFISLVVAVFVYPISATGQPLLPLHEHPSSAMTNVGLDNLHDEQSRVMQLAQNNWFSLPFCM